MAENRPINLRRERVLREYTDPDSPAFSNQTQAALLAYPHMTNGSAAVQGHRVIHAAKQSGELHEYLQAARDSTRVRMATLAAVATGDYESASIVEHEDAEGTVTHRQRTRSSPPASAVVKANDVIAKLDGTYTRQAVARDAISTEYRAIVDKQRRELEHSRKGKA